MTTRFDASITGTGRPGPSLAARLVGTGFSGDSDCPVARRFCPLAGGRPAVTLYVR